ncbi:MAG: tetratricopeptide repeat protein [Ferruginibacter sp.]|nr:tetratricopeptide repeat protein [Ferruginibacter sp.]
MTNKIVQQLLPLLIIVSVGQAQNLKEINGLKEQLKTTAEGKPTIDLLNRIAQAYAVADSANTLLYTNKAAAQSAAAGYKYGTAKSNLYKGLLYVNISRPTEALQAFKDAEPIFQELHRDEDMAYLNSFRGRAYSLGQNFQVAAGYFEKALPYFISIKNKDGILGVYNNLGVLYSNSGERDMGIDYYLKALQISEEINNPNTHLILNNLGKLFYDTNNFAESKKYFLRCMDMSRSANDMVTLGKAELNYGNIFVKEENYPVAVTYYLKAKTSFEKVNFKRGLQSCTNNLGAILLRQQKYTEALPYLEDAVAIAEENKTKMGLALSQQNLAFAYTNLKKFPEALDWFARAEATATKGSDLFTFGEIYNHRAMLDSAMGNFSSAYFYKQKYVQITEQLTGERVTRQVNELQTKYETQKKENQITLLNKDNSIKSLEIQNQQLALDRNLYELAENKLQLADANLTLVSNELSLKTQGGIILQQRFDSAARKKNIDSLQKQSEIQQLRLANEKAEVAKRNIAIAAILLGMCALTYAGFSFYKRYKLKQESLLKTELLKEQELAARAIIQAEENERKRIAADLHDGIGQMMSVAKMNLSVFENELAFSSTQQKDSFENVINLVDDSCREIRNVSHQMMPNALMKTGLANAIREFVDKIDTRVLKVSLHAEGLDERLDTNTETVLYRVIQECVNNVLKHAGANHLDISLIKDSDGLAVTIEDNGKGFNSSDHSSFSGIGLKNIISRIAFLKGTIDFDSNPGHGTLIAIHVPVS